MRVSNFGTSRGRRPRWQSALPALRGAALATLSVLALPDSSQAQLSVEGATLWRQGADGLQGSPGEDDRFGSRLATGDFNGDGRLDVAATVPLEDFLGLAETGVVHVVYGGDGGLQATAPDDQIVALGHQGAPGEGWGSEQFGLGGVTTGDFNGDGFDDLAIASTFDVVDGEGGVGSVLVVPGSANGLVPADALYITGDAIPLPDHVEFRRFGHSVTAGDFDGDGFDDLAVGHRAFVDGIAGAGVVNVFYGSAATLLEVGASTQTLHQGRDGIPGTPEDFDLFGSSLTSGDFDDLAIAAISDGADAPGATSSGSVTIVRARRRACSSEKRSPSATSTATAATTWRSAPPPADPGRAFSNPGPSPFSTAVPVDSTPRDRRFSPPPRLECRVTRSTSSGSAMASPRATSTATGATT